MWAHNPDETGEEVANFVCASCGSTWGYYEAKTGKVCYRCGLSFTVEGHGLEKIPEKSVDRPKPEVVD